MIKIREIDGHKGYYVSDSGQFLSLRGKKMKIIEGVLITLNGKPHYSKVNLDGKQYRIHQLVANAFPEICGEKKEGYEIDHINGNKRDNRACNLRYVTHRENLNNPITKHRIGRKKHKRGTPIYQYTLGGILIGEYKSEKSAAKENNICRSGISETACGRRKTAGGYKWSFSKYSQLP